MQDAPDIARVQVDSWRTSYAGIVPPDYLAGLSYDQREVWWRENLALAADVHCLYVAEDGASGKIIGFAAGGPEWGGNLDYRGEVYAIYLLAGYQRQGTGRWLVRAVVDWLLAHGYQSMLIWVLAANPAREFYASLGGQPVKEKTITIGGAALAEVAYGWPDLALLIDKDGSR